MSEWVETKVKVDGRKNAREKKRERKEKEEEILCLDR